METFFPAGKSKSLFPKFCLVFLVSCICFLGLRAQDANANTLQECLDTYNHFLNTHTPDSWGDWANFSTLDIGGLISSYTYTFPSDSDWFIIGQSPIYNHIYIDTNYDNPNEYLTNFEYLETSTTNFRGDFVFYIFCIPSNYYVDYLYYNSVLRDSLFYTGAFSTNFKDFIFPTFEYSMGDLMYRKDYNSSTHRYTNYAWQALASGLLFSTPSLHDTYYVLSVRAELSGSQTYTLSLFDEIDEDFNNGKFECRTSYNPSSQFDHHEFSSFVMNPQSSSLNGVEYFDLLTYFYDASQIPTDLIQYVGLKYLYKSDCCFIGPSYSASLSGYDMVWDNSKPLTAWSDSSNHFEALFSGYSPNVNPNPSASPVPSSNPNPPIPSSFPDPLDSPIPYPSQVPYYTQIPYPTQIPYYTQIPYPTQVPYPNIDLELPSSLGDMTSEFSSDFSQSFNTLKSRFNNIINSTGKNRVKDSFSAIPDFFLQLITIALIFGLLLFVTGVKRE